MQDLDMSSGSGSGVADPGLEGSGLLMESHPAFPLWQVVMISLAVVLAVSLAVNVVVIVCHTYYWKRRRHTHSYTTSDQAKQPVVQRLNSVYSVKSQENIVRLAESPSPQSTSPLTHSNANQPAPSQTSSATASTSRDQQQATIAENGDLLYDDVTSHPTVLIQGSGATDGQAIPTLQNDTMTSNTTEFEQSQLAEVNLAAFPVSPSDLLSPQPHSPSSKPHFTFEDGTMMQHYPDSVDPEIEGKESRVSLSFPRPPTIYSSQILHTVPSDNDRIELQGMAPGGQLPRGTEMDIDDFADEYIIDTEVDVPIVVIQTPKTTSDDQDRFIMLTTPGAPSSSPPQERERGVPVITETEAAAFVDSAIDNSQSFVNTRNGNVNNQSQQQGNVNNQSQQQGNVNNQSQQQQDVDDVMYDRLLSFNHPSTQPHTDNEDTHYDQPSFRAPPEKDLSSLFDDPGYGKGARVSRRATLDARLLFDDPGYTRGMMLADEEMDPRERSFTLDLFGEFQPRTKETRIKDRRRKVASASYENLPPAALKKRPTKQKARVNLREDIDSSEPQVQVKLKQNLSVQGASTIPFLKGSISSLELLDYQQQELEALDPDIAACLQDEFSSSNELEITQV